MSAFGHAKGALLGGRFKCREVKSMLFLYLCKKEIQEVIFFLLLFRGWRVGGEGGTFIVQ